MKMVLFFGHHVRNIGEYTSYLRSKPYPRIYKVQGTKCVRSFLNIIFSTLNMLYQLQIYRIGLYLGEFYIKVISTFP
jgi:hypothetical protein